jgi:hypothetical protein
MEIMAKEIFTINNEEVVTIPLTHYETLIRISERMRVVENYVRRTDYASRKDLLFMLGVEERAGEE